MMKKNHYIILIVVASTIVMVFLMWFAILFIQSMVPSEVVLEQQPTTDTQTVESTTDASLGAQIYEKNQNPIEEKLPDSNPVKNANPIQGAYTNPF